MKSIKKSEPWEHFLLENIFDEDDFKILKEYPPLDSIYKNAFDYRDTIINRVFINDQFVKNNSKFKNIINFLNNKKVFSKLFEIDLNNGYLRPELIDDRYPFEHEVHTDHPDKLLSILIYIDKDDNQNLASDLFVDKTTHYKKIDWNENSGIAWVNELNNEKWHAFKSPPYMGKRRILIVNWVNKNVWKDKTQLYIEDNHER
jgi:hypothetical protein